MSSVVSPFDHEYVYGVVPPVTVASTEPFAPPGQITLTTPAIDTVTAEPFGVPAGWKPMFALVSVPSVRHGV